VSHDAKIGALGGWRAAAQRPLLLLVLAGACLYGVRLGSTDLVQWDEAYYVSRALAVRQHHAWIDQSDHALGGLWTGAHPPLVVWAMAASSHVFGLGEWVFRLPAALAGLLALVLLYQMARRMTRDGRVAVAAAAVLLATPHFTLYARRAQLDVPATALVLAALASARIAAQRGGRWILLAGACCAGALLVKIAVGFLVPLVLAVY
jgi:4-amino-4-deoxy-L-arabinose transferase-like glycosyltransferase